jgi:hypothetical protein
MALVLLAAHLTVMSHASNSPNCGKGCRRGNGQVALQRMELNRPFFLSRIGGAQV